MAYDDDLGRIVLTCGALGMGALNDTWEFDGDDWQQVDVDAGTLTARLRVAMTYDAGRHRLILYGGCPSWDTCTDPLYETFAYYAVGQPCDDDTRHCMNGTCHDGLCCDIGKHEDCNGVCNDPTAPGICVTKDQ
jgi:hypothetical protein